MPPDDDNRNDSSTYNIRRNEDKALLLRNGYKPGELSPEEERDILQDLRTADDTDDNSEVMGEIGDEQDDTDADAS